MHYAHTNVVCKCASVKFVEGSAEAPPTCKNALGVTAEFSSDSTLDALVGTNTDDDDNGSSDSSATPSGTVSHDHPSETSSEPSGAAVKGSRMDLSLTFSVATVLGLYFFFSGGLEVVRLRSGSGGCLRESSVTRTNSAAIGIDK